MISYLVICDPWLHAAVLHSPGANQTADGPAAVIAAVPQQQAKRHLDDHAGAQVLYIAHPVQVGWEAGEQNQKLKDLSIRRFEHCANKDTVAACSNGISGIARAKLPRTPRTKTWPAEIKNGRLHVSDKPSEEEGQGSDKKGGARRQLGEGRRGGHGAVEAVGAAMQSMHGNEVMSAAFCEREAGWRGYFARHSLQAALRVHAMCSV